ncbi:hypothetical protein VTH82DRAFT_1908 [Thermothelomyces myriococcoides]
MRAPRAAKAKTSKYFNSPSPASAVTTAAASAPRRLTRSSLARFAYNEGTNGSPLAGIDSSNSSSSSSSTPGNGAVIEEVTLGSDIEDAVKTARKRKRTETVVTQSASRRVSTRSTAKGRTETKTKTEGLVKTEIEAEIDAESENKEEEEKEEAGRPRGRVRKPARKVTDAATGAVTVEPPSDWEEMYELVKQMRISGPAANAAVDTMGCERLADPEASPRDRRFQTLVALMLSSQTKDTVNAETMARLRTELPPHEPGARPGLTLENMLAVDPAELNRLINKVGFHNNKTRYLKQAAEILRDRFGSDIPPTIEGLTSLPGVGPKMAHLCMSATNGWGKVEGIGVDVHVHRITNLWGWQRPPTRSPEDTRHALESWLPRDRWKEINWLLVGFGQTVCLPVGRRCGDCELGLRGLCKSADRAKVIEGRRKRDASSSTTVTAATTTTTTTTTMKGEKEEEEEEEEEEEGKPVKVKKEEKEEAVVDGVKMEVDVKEEEERKQGGGVAVNGTVAGVPPQSPGIKQEEGA